MVIVLSIIITFAFAAYRAFTQKLLKEKSLQHQLELDHQKEVSKQYTLVQENERKRIAEMLHDDVGNKLNILSLWINNEDTWTNDRSKDIITQQIPELIEAVRTISHTLYPANLEKFGLIMEIESLIAMVDSSLSIQLIVSDDYHRKDISFEVKIYRIIQEFLTNVIKHAQATQMIVHIRDTNSLFAMGLSDNGIGFTTDSLQNGMGLRNINGRIRSINAKSKWKSRAEKGTKLIIAYPKR